MTSDMVNEEQKTEGRRKQYGAIVYRVTPESQIEVLLLTSRGTGQWILPKGNPEKNMTPSAVARMEVEQEAGYVGDIAREPLGGFWYHKYNKDRTKFAPVYLELFLMRRAYRLPKWEESTERTCEWVDIPRAIRRLKRNTNIAGKQEMEAIMQLAALRIPQAEGLAPLVPASHLRVAVPALKFD